MLKSKIQLLLKTLLCFLLATLIALPTSATDNSYIQSAALNGSYWYNPSGSGFSGCATPGTNTNYAGDTVWTQGELELIEANRPIYEQVASEYPLDWQFLATLHSIETGLRRTNPTSNAEGLYQLHSIRDQHVDLFQPGKEVNNSEFLEQTRLAADFVTKLGYDLTTEEGVKHAFFRYNGIAQVYIQKARDMGFTEEEAQAGNGSAYVMNRFDARRDPTSPEMDTKWPGRFVADGVYDPDSVSYNFGAFTKYAALGGGNGICSGNSDINGLALTLAWPQQNVHSKFDPTPAYQQALNAVGFGSNSSMIISKGASCDVFVATVFRYSGVDPNFFCCGIGGPEGGGYGVYGYLINHPDIYQNLGYISNSSQLMPGDILIKKHEHIELVVQKEDGTFAIASASYNERTADIAPLSIGWHVSEGYEIFRHI